MTFEETVDYLYSQLPAFTRIGAAAYKADLSNILLLCEALGNPQKELRCIHVAGTNGKGSSSHFLASIFQEAGYKTALFTSPHLKDFRERFKINGILIPKEDVVEFVEKNKHHFEQISPSFFEMTVALAFTWFKDQNVDIAVIETGLGGRLDSTNIIHPELSLITNIGFDHTDLLGDTLEKIAFEKAGIIKHGVPVVVSEHQEGLSSVFSAKAVSQNTRIWNADEAISWSQVELIEHLGRNMMRIKGELNGNPITYFSPLTGRYQIKNLKGVITSIEVLKSLGWEISDDAISEGIMNVIQNTNLQGRWQQLSKNPAIFCDTGHNESGIREVLQQIELYPHDQLHFVFGMVKDKSIDSVLALLPKSARYYFCQANIFRALPAEELQKKASEFGLQGSVFTGVENALFAAKQASTNSDLIVVGGSTFVVAEII